MQQSNETVQENLPLPSSCVPPSVVPNNEKTQGFCWRTFLNHLGMDFWRWLLCWWSQMKLIHILCFIKGTLKAGQPVLQKPAVFCPNLLWCCALTDKFVFHQLLQVLCICQSFVHIIYCIIPLSRLPSPPPLTSPAHFPNLVFCGMRTNQEETTINYFKLN